MTKDVCEVTVCEVTRLRSDRYSCGHRSCVVVSFGSSSSRAVSVTLDDVFAVATL